MEAGYEPLARGTPSDPAGAGEDAARVPELRCRVCELEEENTRLRLLVGEMLVTNQRLRDERKAARADQDSRQMRG